MSEGGAYGTNGASGDNGANGANEANGKLQPQYSQQPQQPQQPQYSQQPQQPQYPHQPHQPQPPQQSQDSGQLPPPEPFLKKKGNYESLLVFQKGECIYDITYYFAHHYFVERKDRTIDQVVQAARSGKQNIAEGCAAGTTSSETELRLLGVARASMKEVLEDYKDYLRTRGLTKWHVNDPRTQKTKAFSRKHYNPADYTKDIERRSPEALCNIAITLIHQYDVMMGRLLDRLQKDFVEEGGIREQMTAARLGYRNNQKTRIAQLEAENNSLKARIAELEAKLSSLIALIALIFALASCSTDSEQGAENEEPNATRRGTDRDPRHQPEGQGDDLHRLRLQEHGIRRRQQQLHRLPDRVPRLHRELEGQHSRHLDHQHPRLGIHRSAALGKDRPDD